MSRGAAKPLRGPKSVVQGLTTSMRENPLFSSPARRIRVKPRPGRTVSRATKFAPAAAVSAHRSKARSGLPRGEVLVSLPEGVVAENCPAGHAVIVVVYDDRGKVYVATGRVDQVVAADGGPVAVTHERNHA